MEASERGLPVANGRQTVLIVEDSADDRRLVLRALVGFVLDLEIHCAEDGQEALSALGLADGSAMRLPLPDLIICDVKMPRLGGIEVLERIRSVTRICEIPVVMFSTSSYQPDIDRCLALGARDYCLKPLDDKEFENCVRDIARRWLSRIGTQLTPTCLLDSSVST